MIIQSKYIVMENLDNGFGKCYVKDKEHLTMFNSSGKNK